MFIYRNYQEKQLVNNVAKENNPVSQTAGQVQQDKDTQKQKDQDLKAPDFTLQDLSGQTVSLQDFKGKVVLLNFWSTTCPYCKIEMPELDKTYQKYKDQGLVVLTVNLTGQEKSVQEVQNFMSQKGYHFPVLLDEKLDVADQYGIRSIPTSFFIDREGNVVDAKIGAFVPMELEQKIKGMLK